MIKMKPKSCGCSQCKRGKHGAARDIMRYDERAARHSAKIALAKGEEVVIGIPVGNYYD